MISSLRPEILNILSKSRFSYLNLLIDVIEHIKSNPNIQLDNSGINKIVLEAARDLDVILSEKAELIDSELIHNLMITIKMINAYVERVS